MRVLLTGFTPFDGTGLNASGELVRSLDAEPPPEVPGFALRVACRILPTDTEEGPRRLDLLLEELRPDLVVLTGQARRNHVGLERVALNLRDFGSTPDTGGRLLAGEPVDPGGPAALFSTLGDLAALAAGLRDLGIPARVSNHAGGHLCNQVLYHALSRGARAGFVHVPLLPRQVIARGGDDPFMPLEMTRRALGHLLAALLR